MPEPKTEKTDPRPPARPPVRPQPPMPPPPSRPPPFSRSSRHRGQWNKRNKG